MTRRYGQLVASTNILKYTHNMSNSLHVNRCDNTGVFIYVSSETYQLLVKGMETANFTVNKYVEVF
jgi:hypothetical protein